MNINRATIIQSIVFSIFASLCISVNAHAGDYEALDGLNEIKVVFDVRAKKVKKAFVQLDLIHQTFKDKNIRAVTENPEFVVVIAGSAVRFVSTDTEEFTAEEKVFLGPIADTLSAMAKDGIKLEICMFAANLLDVDPATILPEIKQVPNGWISLLGYQAKGYNLVSAF